MVGSTVPEVFGRKSALYCNGFDGSDNNDPSAFLAATKVLGPTYCVLKKFWISRYKFNELFLKYQTLSTLISN